MIPAAVLIPSLVIVLEPEAVIKPLFKRGILIPQPVQLCTELCIGLPFCKKCFLAGLVDTHAVLADGRSRALVTAPAAVEPVGRGIDTFPAAACIPAVTGITAEAAVLRCRENPAAAGTAVLATPAPGATTSAVVLV